VSGSGNQEAPGERRGVFITFEGGEGSGKSTQIGLLAERLAGMGCEVLTTREPGGSPKAEQLREIILSGLVEPYGPVAETMAFAAARIDHLDKTIRPALQEGCIVICDRFMDSTRAYQGALGDVEESLIDRLEKVAVGDTRPDLTLILDLPPETGLKRAKSRRGEDEPDRFEGEEIEFHRAVREAFLRIAANQPQRCARVFAAKPEDEVAADVWRVVRERLGSRLALDGDTEPGQGGAGQDKVEDARREAEIGNACGQRGPNLRVVSDAGAPGGSRSKDDGGS